jgi:hypothetical protein
MNSKQTQQEEEKVSLSKAAETLLNECRMLLPGIETLFGFQLIAVFNATFAEKLTPFEQRLHLLAMTLIIISLVVIMTPAAYHRQTRPFDVTQQFIHLSTRLLLISSAPLALGISLDFYLICRLILKDAFLPFILAIAVFALFIALWYVLPNRKWMQSLFSGQRK